MVARDPCRAGVVCRRSRTGAAARPGRRRCAGRSCADRDGRRSWVGDRPAAGAGRAARRSARHRSGRARRSRRRHVAGRAAPGWPGRGLPGRPGCRRPRGPGRGTGAGPAGPAPWGPGGRPRCTGRSRPRPPPRARPRRAARPGSGRPPRRAHRRWPRPRTRQPAPPGRPARAPGRARRGAPARGTGRRAVPGRWRPAALAAPGCRCSRSRSQARVVGAPCAVAAPRLSISRTMPCNTASAAHISRCSSAVSSSRSGPGIVHSSPSAPGADTTPSRSTAPRSPRIAAVTGSVTGGSGASDMTPT
jgi:hypothetical protein